MRDRLADDVTAVRADDLAAAAAVVVRFRRRRRATMAAALSVAAMAVVSTRTLYDATSASLVPTGPAPATAPADGGGGGAVTSPTPPVPLPPGSGTGTGTGGGGLPSDSSDDPFAPVAPGPEETARDRARSAPSRMPMTRNAYYQNAGQPCAVNPVPAFSRLCVDAKATPRKDGTLLLTYRVCQEQPSLNAVRLDFATAQEAEFAIATGGRIIWRWGTGQRFAAKKYSVSLGTTQCLRWQTVWDGRLDNGERVAPGRYKLRGAGRDSAKLLRLDLFTFDVKKP